MVLGCLCPRHLLRAFLFVHNFVTLKKFHLGGALDGMSTGRYAHNECECKLHSNKKNNNKIKKKSFTTVQFVKHGNELLRVN